MGGWQWDMSGQKHKMRNRLKKKKVVLHSVSQFLKSASKDLLCLTIFLGNNSWRLWKQVWRVKKINESDGC